MRAFLCAIVVALACPVAAQAEIYIDDIEAIGWEYQPAFDRYVFTAEGVMLDQSNGGPVPPGWKCGIKPNPYGAASGGSGYPDANGNFTLTFAIQRANIPQNGATLWVDLQLVNIQLRQFDPAGVLNIPNPLAP